MAFKKSGVRNLNAVKLISRNDGAVDLELSDFALYDKDPITNESYLKLLDGKSPTIFLCNFEVTGKDGAAIQDSMIGGVDDEKNPKMTMGKWAYEITRRCLKDIQNPVGETDVIKLSRDSKGYVSDETMTELQRYGIVNEIFNHYFTLTQSEVKSNSKNS